MKKNTGKFLILWLSIVTLLISCIPFTSFARDVKLPSRYIEDYYEYMADKLGTEYEEAKTDEFKYRSYKSGYVVIYDYAKKQNEFKELHFPSEINGQKVIQVQFRYGYYPNGGNETIEKIIFDEGIEGISGFNGLNALKEVVFPSTLKFIDDLTFYRDENLTTAVFPENLECVGRMAFTGTNITAEKFKIGKYLYIDAGDDEGYPVAFGIKSGIGEYEVDKGNPYYKSVDGVLFSKGGNTLYAYPGMKKDKAYTVPKSTQRILIWTEAFASSKYLENVDVSGGLFERVFINCPKLKYITFEKDCNPVISEKHFTGCEKLKKITLKNSDAKIKAEPYSPGVNWDNISVSGNERVCGVRVLKSGTNSLTLKWEPVSKAKKYEIKISLDDGKTWKKKAEATGDSAKITGLEPGKQVRIKIRGINGNKKYGYSQVYAFTTRPETPQIRKAYPVHDNTAICLKIDGLVDDIFDRYRINVTVATDKNFENTVTPSRVWLSSKEDKVHIYLPKGTYYVKIKNVKGKYKSYIEDTDYRNGNACLESGFSKTVKVTL